MSTDNKPPTQLPNGNDVESLTITLQQIAASAQTNTEQFESQKKQFFEQFSQLFGSLNTLKQQQLKLNIQPQTTMNNNTINSIEQITPKSTTPGQSDSNDNNNTNINNNNNNINNIILSKIATNTLNLTP
eukprot:406355_1